MNSSDEPSPCYFGNFSIHWSSLDGASSINVDYSDYIFNLCCFLVGLACCQWDSHTHALVQILLSFREEPLSDVSFVCLASIIIFQIGIFNRHLSKKVGETKSRRDSVPGLHTKQLKWITSSEVGCSHPVSTGRELYASLCLCVINY